MPKRKRQVDTAPAAVTSLKDLKKDLKRGNGVEFFKRVPEEGITVRFMYDPDDSDHPWIKFYEHYDTEQGYFPCIGLADGCEGDHEKRTPSMRFLANAIDVSENKVVPFCMPKTLANAIIKKYERYGTLTDRDYEIAREGAGKETEYEVETQSPTKMNTKRFKPLDLKAMLAGQVDALLNADSADEDDDEDERPKRHKPVKKAIRKPTIADEDDDDAEERPRRAVKRAVARPPKKVVKKKLHR